ncbi:TlpA family protein disulfide reductase [Carboxylicivirga sp. A043]|uniref:TlpA family protein disulfide reductase n=1 Tax=Carboxylicivirga litoralis TaxID=2816963 RepID=UPI0021CB3B5E|nr:TlpA disulfide reductase family protein [Carboxylicivirga sp. A043]MCU4155351.1 TlpA family protein disulfide reductase [Carboxylicivirga sp. A043]
MRVGLFAIFLFITTVMLAQQPPQWVTIKGNAPEYADFSLVMQKIENPISGELSDLMVISVSDDGSFEQSIEISSITYATINMGKYEGSIYLEPGQTYELILPPFQPRTDAERFNPYFIPESIELGIANEEAQGLNRMITDFDSYFSQQYNANAVNVFSRGDIRKAQEIIDQTDSLFHSIHPYFVKYKQYAYGELLTLAYKRNKRKAMYFTMKGDSLNFSMPSFQRSFNTLFKSFFTSYFSSKQGDALRDAYTKTTSFDSLSTVFRKDTLFTNPEIAEFVLLKGLYEAFYSGRYDQEQIIELFKQAHEQGSTLNIKDFAKSLHRKVTWLRPGSAAPQFTLYRLDGKERSLSDYEGKFVYLNFMHTSNHTCKEELQLLDILSKDRELRRKLTLVTIIMDEDPTAAEKLVKDNKYRWDFLHYAAMPKVALDYRIRALPAYFVLDPGQKLRLSPSPSPGESFIPQFTEAQRKYHYEQLRKEKPKTKSIYDI